MEAERVEYLRGFVHGMHFLLLALEGRVMAARGDMTALRKAFEEYHLLVEDYRETFEAPAATSVALRYEDDSAAN